MNKLPIFFTIVARNYISYARTLTDSIIVQYPNAIIYVVICDRNYEFLDTGNAHIKFISLEELSLPNFYQFAFRYDILEFSTAIKPYVFKWIFEKRHHKSAIYLDPDIYLISPLTEVEKKLKENVSAVLTPHLLDPINDNFHPNERTMLQVGSYNLGFIAINNNLEGNKLIKWWGNRLEKDAFVDLESGLFTDQKWANLMPSLFHSVYILRHPGYNLAYWNLSQRKVSSKNKKYFVNDMPMVFVHFSGIDPLNPTIFSKHQNRLKINNIGVLKPIFDHYIKSLMRNDYIATRKLPYEFDFFNDGTRISSAMRFYYNNLQNKKYSNPFKELNANFFRKNENLLRGNSNLTREMFAFYSKNINLHGKYNLFSKIDRNKFTRDFSYLYDQGQSQSFKGKNFIFILIGLLKGLVHISLIRKKESIKKVKKTIGHTFYDFLKSIYVSGPAPIYLYELNKSKLDLNSIDIVGYAKGDFGVAQNLRGVVEAFKLLDYKINVLDISTNGSQSETDQSLNKYIKFKSNSYIQIYCVNADQTLATINNLSNVLNDRKYKIGYWFWELAEFPKAWMGAFDKLDEVWAPTKFIYECLRKVSPIPVYYVPVVVEPKFVKSFDRNYFGLPGKSYLFHFSYDFHSFSERKNPDAVLKAFQYAFKNKKDNVGLVIKMINGEKYPILYNKLISKISKDNRIFVVNKTLNRQEMYGLINSCDAYVSLHRAEGFGLGLAESMFFSKPVVATGYSGNLDFMNNKNSCIVPYKLIKLKKNAYPFWQNQYWAQPSIKDAADFMKKLASDRLFRIKLSKLGELTIKENHSAEKVSKLITLRLKSIIREN